MLSHLLSQPLLFVLEIEKLLIARIQVCHHGTHIFIADVCAGAALSILLDSFEHAIHLHLDLSIVKIELLVEFLRILQLSLLLFLLCSQLLKVERVLKLLLPNDNLAVLSLELAQLFCLSRFGPKVPTTGPSRHC